MKKLLSLAVAALLVLGLAACGNSQSQSADVDLTTYYESMACLLYTSSAEPDARAEPVRR